MEDRPPIPLPPVPVVAMWEPYTGVSVCVQELAFIGSGLVVMIVVAQETRALLCAEGEAGCLLTDLSAKRNKEPASMTWTVRRQDFAGVEEWTDALEAMLSTARRHGFLPSLPTARESRRRGRERTE